MLAGVTDVRDPASDQLTQWVTEFVSNQVTVEREALEADLAAAVRLQDYAHLDDLCSVGIVDLRAHPTSRTRFVASRWPSQAPPSTPRRRLWWWR